MAQFVHQIDRLIGSPLKRNQLTAVVIAYRAWTRKVGGGPHARRLEGKLALCNRVLGHVTTFYAIRSSLRAYGKDMWVDLVTENQTSDRLGLTLTGSLEATGVYPAYAGTSYDKNNRAWRYDWGGSSADMAAAPPGRSTTRVPIAMGYLPMHFNGTILNVQPEILVSSVDSTSSWCSLPVPNR